MMILCSLIFNTFKMGKGVREYYLGFRGIHFRYVVNQVGRIQGIFMSHSHIWTSNSSDRL